MLFRSHDVLIALVFAAALFPFVANGEAQTIGLSAQPRVIANPKSPTMTAEFGVPAIQSRAIGTDNYWYSHDGKKFLTVLQNRFVLRAPGTKLMRKYFRGKFLDEKGKPNVGDRLGQRTLAVGGCGDSFRLAWVRDKDKEVQVWDVEKEKLLCKFPFRIRKGSSYVMFFSDDGKFLTVWQHANYGKAILLEVWDVSTGKKRCQCEPPKAAMYCRIPVMSHDGKLLAIATQEDKSELAPKTIHLWDTSSGKLLFTLRGLRASMADLQFSRDDTRLIGVTSTAYLREANGRLNKEVLGKVLVWNTKTGKKVVGFENWLRNVAISPSGNFFAQQTKDQQRFRIVDLRNGKISPQTFSARGYVTFSADDTLLATGQGPYGLDIYDVATGKLLRTCEKSSYYYLAGFTRDNSRLIAVSSAGSGHNKIRAWDVKTGKEIVPKTGHTDLVRGVKFSPDVKYVASYGEDNKVCVWNAKAKKQEFEVALKQPIVDLMWSHSSKTLIVLDKEGTVRWFDLKGKCVGNYAAGKGVEKAKLADGGRKLVVQRNGGELIDLVTKKTLKNFKISTTTPQDGAARFAFFQIKPLFEVSPDGKYLAHCGLQTISETGRIRLDLYSTETGRRLRSINLSQQQTMYQHTVCTNIRFSPDSRLLLTSTGNASNSLRGVIYSNIRIRMWEVDSGQMVYTSEDLPLNSNFLELSPGGWVLAHPDGTRHAWMLHQHLKVTLHPTFSEKVPDLSKGKIKAMNSPKPSVNETKYPGVSTTGRPTSVSFSPDGKQLAIGTENHTVLIQDVAKFTVTPKSPLTSLKTPTEKLAEQLGSSQAQDAYVARQRLVLRPKEAVTILQKRLKPTVGVDPKKINKWIADLDHERFAVRQRAYLSLAKVGRVAEPQLRKARKTNKALEFLQRVQRLIDRFENPNPKLLAKKRALAVLEQIGSPESIAVLRTLAKGHPSADLTRAAKSALWRLERRGVGSAKPADK